VLSKKNAQSEGPEGKEADEYFAGLEEKFVKKATEMGYEYNAVKQFIEEKGMPDNDMAILVSGMAAKYKYRNRLYQPPKKSEGLQYEYFNPGGIIQFSHAPQGPIPNNDARYNSAMLLSQNTTASNSKLSLGPGSSMIDKQSLHN